MSARQYIWPPNSLSGTLAVDIEKYLGMPVGPTNPIDVEISQGGNTAKVVNVAGTNGLAIYQLGNEKNQFARLDYSSTNVDNTNWTTLIASLLQNSAQITVFDSGGYAMELGVGPIGSEQRVLLIPPGGLNGAIPLFLGQGLRLSVRAIGASLVSAGEIDINILGNTFI